MTLEPDKGGQEKRRKYRELETAAGVRSDGLTDQKHRLACFISIFSYSLALNEQISSLSPRMSFFIVQSQVIQSNTPLNQWFRPF